MVRVMMWASQRKRWFARLGGLALASATLTAALVGITAWRAPLPERLTVAPSAVLRWQDGEVAHVALAPDERWRMAVRQQDVEPELVDALLRFEDKRFYSHPGVDPVAVLRAVVANVSAGRVRMGASTITMQLVRVLEPRPRTLTSKLVEAHRALTLELHLSKAEILEAYLTFAPYGRNVEGVHAASLAYFGHDARHLTTAEIATLLAVPQRPTSRWPSPGNTERLRAARDEIAARMVEARALSLDRGGAAASAADVLAEVRATAVPTQLRPFPREVPHVASWGPTRAPDERDVTLTLDRGIHRTMERLIAADAEHRRQRGIFNGAIIVIEHDTGAVRALVGNQDFWDNAHGGQINAFDVPRSPGSTLKPLIYAMGIERGLALPGFLVRDVPVAYGAWQPRNYDGRFEGLVRLDEALSRSLNLPFVFLLDGIGVQPFVRRLQRLGARRLHADPDHYGLSIAAGGIELTPLEMAGVYATFARGGAHLPVRWRADAPLGEPQALLAPGAVQLTTEALSLRDRPDFPTRSHVAGRPPPIAWKTGTSYGHRDAWAIGYGARYTAVVWLGNVDQQPSAYLIGGEAAGALLFDVLEAITPRDQAPERRAPDLTQVQVCRLSGRLPGPGCSETHAVPALRAAVPTETCPYHVTREIDQASGLAVAPGCRAGRDAEARTYVAWPASVRRFLRSQHRALPEVPSWAPGCEPAVTATPPSITRPVAGQVSVLIPGMAADEQELPFEAEVTGEERTLSWFVNGRHVGTADADERVWWSPVVGTHEVSVVDAAGRVSRRAFQVVRR